MSHYKITDNTTKSYCNAAPTFFYLDAEGFVLGRLTSYLSEFLRGKCSAKYTPNANMKLILFILNPDKVVVSGNKTKGKIYYRHTGYLGGLKSRTFEEVSSSKNPEQIIMKSLKGMMNNGPLFYKIQSSIKFLYNNDSNSKVPSNAVRIDFSSMNEKNKLRNINL